MQFSKLNPLRLLHKPTTFQASSGVSEDLWREAQVSPAFRATVENSHRWKTATPEQRTAWVRREVSKSAPVASVAPSRPGPAALVPVKKAAPSASDWSKLNAEAEQLLSLAGRALARVRADKARAEVASLTGLDKARAGFKAQLANSGLAAPDGTGGELDAVKRSKPSQNPAFVPEPNSTVRVRQCRAYYEQELAEIEVELQDAIKRGKIPQEIIARKNRTEKEYTLALDKALGRDIRK
jgi:hypothetical protein